MKEKKMDRYLFEVLSFIERNGKKKYDMREFANVVRISEPTILSCIKEAQKDNLLTSGEQIGLTDEGLRALEPYRVKKAVIMAAGFGKRMLPATADKPKPMVTVRGKRIIDTLLDSLAAVGIKDIVIIRGYKKEKFDELLEKYPYIRFIDNDLYEQENNISSVIKALDSINNCYLCEADLYISNPKVITKYQYASNILGSYSLETDDWSFRQKDGYICDYRKGNTFCFNYYGISYWTAEDSEKLHMDWSDIYQTRKDVFWEEVPLILKKDNYQVEIRLCEKSDIVEIDNYYELAELDDSYTVIK